MAEYRTGNHWGVTIVREDPPHDAQLVAVVTTRDVKLAERICALLNRDEDAAPTRKCGARGMAMGPGCIRRAGHEGRHGYSDGSGEQDCHGTGRSSDG